MKAADPRDPGTWNRYAYVNGDPINRGDPTGLCNVVVAGITEHSSNDVAINNFASENGSIETFPYSGGNIPDGLLSVASQGLLSANSATIAAALAVYLASVEDPNNPIDITTFSGGAQAFSSAMALLPGLRDRIGNVTYVSPGATGSLFAGQTTTAVMGGGSLTEVAVSATGYANLPAGTNLVITRCGHDFACQIANAGTEFAGTTSCPEPVTISSPPPTIQGFPFNNLFGPFGPLEIVYSSVQYEEVTSRITYYEP
jgi:hypothetical protein